MKRERRRGNGFYIKKKRWESFNSEFGVMFVWWVRGRGRGRGSEVGQLRESIGGVAKTKRKGF